MTQSLRPTIHFEIPDLPDNMLVDYLTILPRPSDPAFHPNPIGPRRDYLVGRFNVVVSNSPDGSYLRIRTPVVHKRFVRLYLETASEWIDIGVKGEWSIPVNGQNSICLRVASENFARPGRHRVAEWSGEFDLRASLIGSEVEPLARTRMKCRVSPVLLTSSLDPVERVYVVDSPLTEKFVNDMAIIIPECGAKLDRLIFHDAVPSDVWAQDCMEIMGVALPSVPPKQYPAILSGIRSRHSGVRTAPLDHNVRHYFQTINAMVIDSAEPRSKTRWIDWLGNLEVTPPHSHPDGREFPFGRILIGKQNELGLHHDVLRFLEYQGYQWPPIELDVSFLTIGHVDEVVTFLPRPAMNEFTVMMPSIRLARSILFELIEKKLGGLPVFQGKTIETTVQKLYYEVAMSDENRTIEERLGGIRSQLSGELGLTDSDFVESPVLYVDGLALFPNMVNCLVCNHNVVLPDPCGPLVEDVDPFIESVRTQLQALKITEHIVDVWEPFHVRSGEVHCATNALRRLRKCDWWNYPKNVNYS